MKYEKKFDVIGLGSPLLDYIIEIDDSVLEELNLRKGEMHLIDADQSSKIFDKLKDKKIIIAPGGSSANTMAGISDLGGKSVFTGKVGSGERANIYEQKTYDCGVLPKLSKHIEEKTGHAITLITPDGERTFATHLGAAIYFSKDDVIEVDIWTSKILHIEGYMLEAGNTKEACMKAMESAKKNDVKVSIDLSDPALIERNLKSFKDIVQKFADIIFVNEKEAEVFTGTDPENALHKIAEFCEVAVVKLGSEGSLIKYQGKVIRVDPFKTEVVNTNGAGDMYSAGILFGITHGITLEKAGKIASYAAAQVVASKGARLERSLIDDIKKL